MLLHGSVIFFPASRAFQFKHIRRPCHHRKSLAHTFLATVSAPPPRRPVISNGAGRLFLPASLLRSGRLAQREISLLFAFIARWGRTPGLKRAVFDLSSQYIGELQDAAALHCPRGWRTWQISVIELLNE